LAVVCSNATYTVSDGVYTFTVTADGALDVIAQPSYGVEA
jgi:hypothetical protein